MKRTIGRWFDPEIKSGENWVKGGGGVSGNSEETFLTRVSKVHERVHVGEKKTGEKGSTMLSRGRIKKGCKETCQTKAEDGQRILHAERAPVRYPNTAAEQKKGWLRGRLTSSRKLYRGNEFDLVERDHSALKEAERGGGTERTGNVLRGGNPHRKKRRHRKSNTD